jgi:quinol monooxygenase YgiN
MQGRIMRISFHLIMATATALVAVAPAALAQDASDPTRYVMRYIEVAPSAKDQGADLVKKLAAESKKDAGVMRFDVVQRTAPANQFLTIEIWKDQASLDAHMAAAHTKQFLDAVKPLLLAPIDDRPCIALDVAPMEAGGPRAVYVITHVDVIPPSREAAVGMLHTAAAAARKEKGNLGFDVVQQTARSNHFQVIDIWSSAKAEDEHEVAADTKELRGKLLPLGGALYDRRWYRPLGG